ncbi:MAG TPA: nucleotidyltransferase family protein [Planctomycetaceae bacterium]|jgi:molybdenum cofactor cytidylyltransferase|nr:nucleotidyltransferase family protein [Planctomycetaceae bacterium]
MPDRQSKIFPFALVPAAGRSRRMSAPKLLLDLGGETVIACVLAALNQAGLAERIVVLHPQDDALRREVERQGGLALVPPSPPPEMRDSIAFGLRQVAREIVARGENVDLCSPWLLIPADHPVVLADTVTTLLEAARRNSGRIVVPTHDGRRGHPTLFCWKHALEIDQIPEGEGFNWILKRHAADVIEVAVASPSVLVDLDTPEDYERLRKLWETG